MGCDDAVFARILPLLDHQHRLARADQVLDARPESRRAHEVIRLAEQSPRGLAEALTKQRLGMAVGKRSPGFEWPRG